MDMPIGQSTLSEMLPLFILIAFLFAIIIFCTYMAVKTTKMQKDAKKERKEIMKANNASLMETFIHFSGLPIPEGVACKVISLPDRYDFIANGATISLSKNKVTDICLKSDAEIQKQYVSSAAGAVGGALLFGPVGALIGGRVKEKKTKQIFTYLIFTYEANGELKYLALDVTYSVPKALKYKEEFKQNATQHNLQINL